MLAGEYPFANVSASSQFMLGNLTIATTLISQKGLIIRGAVAFPQGNFWHVSLRMKFLEVAVRNFDYKILAHQNYCHNPCPSSG